MPRYRRSTRKKGKSGSCATGSHKCSRLYCQYFAVPGEATCSICGSGNAAKDQLGFVNGCVRYQSKVKTAVKRFTCPDETYSQLLEGTDGQLLPFLRKLRIYEQGMPEFGLAKLMFRAEQVLCFMDGYESCSAWNILHQKEATISPHDKLLGRVLDWWNLGKHCFPGVIQCYWGSHGDYISPVEFYNGREKCLHRNSRGLGIMRVLLYCARVGDESPTLPRRMTVGMLICRLERI